MAGRTDPDSVQVVVGDEDRPVPLPHAARDQVAAWFDDPAAPESIRVWIEGGQVLRLTR